MTMRSNIGFNQQEMPARIQTRSLMPFSVHCSTTGRWIATIHVKQTGDDVVNQRGCLHFSFATEREAKKFAKAYSPPRMTPLSEATSCFICKQDFRSGNACNCRNCGVCVCDRCSAKWGIKMIPKTYSLGVAVGKVRVCKSCDWLSNAFCMALLRGNFNDAVAFHETGNVNLRCTFADINREAMFPVHTAVMGGNLLLLRWLVETHACPITAHRSTSRKNSILTSSGRSMMDLAMTGRPKLDILQYLAAEKNMSVLETKDPKLAQTTLDAFLRRPGGADAMENERIVADECFPLKKQSSIASESIEDACALCCEQSMDCVLIPCGHQICCSQCGKQLDECPVCKVKCSVLRIFRQ